MLYMCLVSSSFCRLTYGHAHISSRLNNTAEISKTKLSAVIEDLQTALRLNMFLGITSMKKCCLVIIIIIFFAMNCLLFDLSLSLSLLD